MEKKPATKKDSSKILEGIIRKLVKEEMGKKPLKEDTAVLYNDIRDVVSQHAVDPKISTKILDDINQVLKKYRQYLD